MGIRYQYKISTKILYNIYNFQYFNFMYMLMYVIWDPIIHTYALIVPNVSVRWPKDGEEWLKHVATIINKLITIILLLCLTENINNLFTLHLYFVIAGRLT